MAAEKTSRARELDRLYQMRRGHAPQISISDDKHHVTEAIGDLYGGEDEPTRRSSRPLSFLPSPNGDSIQAFGEFEPFNPFPTPPPAKSPLRPLMVNEKPPTPTSPDGNITVPQSKASRGRTPNGQMSPPLSRSNSDTASQQFPLNNVAYESSPAGLAQELSNLQAIRRMSMGINNADPDLPSFKSSGPAPLGTPPIAEDEEEQQLFWVPARLHPELAPREFKSFIEEKVEKIRRRSGDGEMILSADSSGRKPSVAGLARKKSMLSRQINTGAGYRDGAERLERKRSIAQPNGGLANLQELEHIVEDPAQLIRRTSLDSKGSDDGTDGDSPIIAGKIGGPALKRSTRTTYRRGSVRKNGPALSRRLPARQADTDGEESPATSPTTASHPPIPPIPAMPLTRVQSDPSNGIYDSLSNFSRPQRRRSPPDSGTEQRPSTSEGQGCSSASTPPLAEQARPQQKAFHSRIASNGRTTAPLPGYNPPTQVPQIIETPPPREPPQKSQRQLPERLSSRQPPPSQHQQHHQVNGPRSYQNQSPPQPLQQRQALQTQPNRPVKPGPPSPNKPTQTFDEALNPMPLPGNNAKVDASSLTPDVPEDKKDKKSKDRKDEGPRKTSWGWFSGGDKTKEREQKEKEARDAELAKKVKNKLVKPQEKCHDVTRLDVLQQTALQPPERGRESTTVDRETARLEEERKKESFRRASGESKKEKEGGLLSSIFGGGKKKSEKELVAKKNATRGLSPEPPPRILKPDIDYNWTRFSILEERAIYRMAHIKLANPRRELYSQVLLSNFMYSYLAKVQQMHPQISIGNSKQARQAQQQQQKKEQQQQQGQGQSQSQQTSGQQPQQQQPEEFTQYQRYQKQQQDQHRNQPSQPERSEWPTGHNDPPSQNGHQHHQLYNNYKSQPRDSHHSQYSANGSGGGAGGANHIVHASSGGAYSVAGSQSYMGYHGYEGGTEGVGEKNREREDDMW